VAAWFGSAAADEAALFCAMTSKSTWFWLGLALFLLAFIVLVEPHLRKPPPAPARILPELSPGAVTSLQIRPGGTNQFELLVDQTNHQWQLHGSESGAYPAEAAKIENVLSNLATLTPAAFISPNEVRARPHPDEEFGFAAPQASIIVMLGEEKLHVLLGAFTAPGDQVYLQVVGREGVYVVDAGLFALLPKSINDWRDPALVTLEGLNFDRLAVTNKTTAFVLQRDAATQDWRVVWPPINARADNARIEDALTNLQSLRVQSYAREEAKPDLEALGLAPPELEIALGLGTNTVTRVQFGKSPTNDAALVYARRPGFNVLCVVPSPPLALWRGAANDFRDPHLVTAAEASATSGLEVRSPEPFLVERDNNNDWHLMPQGSLVDNVLTSEFVTALARLHIVQFARDVVTIPELADYGLSAPFRQIIMKSAPTNAPGSTNGIIQLSFGFSTNQPGKIFARRADEPSIYAVSPEEFARLPAETWQLRSRRLWSFSAEDVTALMIRQHGKDLRLLHQAPYKWSVAPGYSGIVEDLAIEETVKGLAKVSAITWVARGDAARARCGFNDAGMRIAFELKNGEKPYLEFGGEAPSKLPYAAVLLDGQPWIMEFPLDLYAHVTRYLAVH